MRHLDSFLLTFIGYLTCAIGPFALAAILGHGEEDSIWWLTWGLGIGLHIWGAIRYQRKSQANAWNKLFYWILPVPVGFFLTFFYVMYLFWIGSMML